MNRRRRITAHLCAVAIVATVGASCGDDTDDGSLGDLITTTSSATTTTTATTPADTTTTAAATAPSELVGQTDPDPTHWAPSAAEAPQRYTVRTFGDTAEVIAGFPNTQSGCGTRQLRVTWRSLGGDVVAGYTFYTDPGMAIVPDAEAPPTTEGTMVLSGCEQPTFRTDADTITDIAVDVVVYDPAP